MKEHRFVNHSEEYAKGNMHVNIHRSVPDGSEGISEVFKYATLKDIKKGMKWGR